VGNEGDERALAFRWSAPRLREAERRAWRAGVARPGALDGSLDDATPLPGTAYKVEIAKALVKRAVAGLDSR
jgi:hypothetical protein